MRYVVLLALIGGLLAFSFAGATETAGVVYLCQDDDGARMVQHPDDCDGTVYEIEGRIWTPPTGTATETPTMTATATKTPTATASPTATSTAVSGECSVPDGADTWHAPTDHEHGDKPPVWADDWSCAQFGHPVIFGGDEQTPNENIYKHNAFKGYSFNVTADDGSTVNIYARVHMQTNPHGRMAQYHSAEWYFRDATGAISLMQWWSDFGTQRLSFAQEGDYYNGALVMDSAVRTTNPLNVIIGYDDTSNPGYHASYSGTEFWYAQASAGGDWMPTFTVDFYDPSTFYTAGEETTATDQATWKPTGDFGLNRRLGFRWIAGGSTLQNIQGQPYLTRNMDDPRGWFCTDLYGAILSSGSPECAAGSLPQHIAPSLPTIGDVNPNGSNPVPRHYQKTWACPACGLPN